MIDFLLPYGYDLKIGDTYTKAIEKCEGWICLMDYDTLRPPGFAERLREVVKIANKDTIYGCMTNRVGWKHAAVVEGMFLEDSITKHLNKANELWNTYKTETEPTNVVPGYCMLFHKELANEFLPIPNRITFDRIICENRKTELMKGIYIIHLYRWGTKNPSIQTTHLHKENYLLNHPTFTE